MPNPQPSRPLLACLLLVTLHCNTPASEAPQLPSVTVQASEKNAIPVRPTLTSERLRLNKIPGGTNLVTPQKEARLATLRDALDYQPGIVIQDFFGGTDQPRLNIRGSGIQSNPVNRGVLLLQDGLPLNEADGSFIIGLIDARNSALISVRRGANALAPGASTLGGEIDFISLTGADGRGTVRSEVGSFGRQALQTAFGEVGESMDGRISFSHDQFSGYRRHSNSKRDNLQANIGIKAANGLENRSYLSWTDLNFKIPGTVPKDRIFKDPRGVMGDGNTPQDLLINIYQRDPRRASSQLRVANKTSWNEAALKQEVGIYWQYTTDLFNNGSSHTLTNSRTVGGQWQAEGRSDGNTDNGAFGYRSALAWSRSEMGRDMFATNQTNGQQLQRFGNFDLLAQNYHAVFGGDWRMAPNLRLVADLKWSHVTRDALALGTSSPTNAPTLNQSWSFATPKIGINWAQSPATRWYANLSRSQEAPTYREIINNKVSPSNPAGAQTEWFNLNLQRATTLELGGEGTISPNSNALNWSATFYRSQVSAELISTTNADGIKVGTYNYQGGTYHQGIEAGMNGRWRLATGTLDYRSSWTYSDFRFKGGEYAGNQIAGVPRHLINGEVLYGLGAWRLGPNVRWLPRSTPVDHANTAGSQQDRYALLGLKAEWRVKAWSAFIQGENLTDKRYASSYGIGKYTAAGARSYLPGLGRNFSAGLAYQF